LLLGSTSSNKSNKQTKSNKVANLDSIRNDQAKINREKLDAKVIDASLKKYSSLLSEDRMLQNQAIIMEVIIKFYFQYFKLTIKNYSRFEILNQVV
jgi:hypothetical protein